jgi:hypothetical protein
MEEEIKEREILKKRETITKRKKRNMKIKGWIRK